MTQRGLFITVEGVEGAGKSTQLQYIVEELKRYDVDLVQTREPGGTPLSEEIRELLLCPRDNGMSSKAELMLMFAARAEHLERVIIPALDQGQWVVCDRFTDATYAYQGGGRGLSTQMIQALEKLTHADLQPDHTLYLDLSVEEGLKRASERGELDRFEQEDTEFFNRVRAAYLQRADQYAERFRVVDASISIDGVQQQIRHILAELINSQS